MTSASNRKGGLRLRARRGDGSRRPLPLLRRNAHAANHRGDHRGRAEAPRRRRGRAPARRRRDDLRPARAHDLAHHRRLRGDGRAGVVASSSRPSGSASRAPSRHVLDYFAARLGALPRRPVRHPPPLHDRAQPEGGQRRGAGRGDRDPAALCRRTASSRSARSASTRRRRPRTATCAPARARQRARAAGHGPHPAPRQEARHAARWTCSPSTASTPSVLIDHNNEVTVEDVLARGCWAAFSIYPDTKMARAHGRIVRRYGPERLIIDSACDWGVSDPLAVPKTARLMAERGIIRRRSAPSPTPMRSPPTASAARCARSTGRSGADRSAHALPGQLGAARRADAGHPRAGRSGGRAADRLSGLASAAARCRVRRRRTRCRLWRRRAAAPLRAPGGGGEDRRSQKA